MNVCATSDQVAVLIQFLFVQVDIPIWMYVSNVKY